MPLAELFSPPSCSCWEGRGTLSFTLLGKILLGLFPPFLRAWKDLHRGCTSGSRRLNSLLCLITALQATWGGLCDLCSACFLPAVSMVNSRFPLDHRQQEEAGSTAAEGELGQHPTQNMPQSQGGCRQVGYLGSVLGTVGNHGSGTVSLLIAEERLLAVHTIEINTPTKLRVLVSKDRLCNLLSLIQQKRVKCLCSKYRNKSQRHLLVHEQASRNSINNSSRVYAVSSGQLPSCSLQLSRARMLACACSWHGTVSNWWWLKGTCHRFLHLIMVK